MEPKVWKDSLLPATWPQDPDKEWCPPGHGDIYTALVDSGMLQTLLGAGYEYAFVSNADNLGAVLDLAILGFFAEQRIPFLMEVAERTAADRKGGHLARSSSGQLILRESAQCPPDEEAEFQDIHRYCYFNTNNLWLNLRALADLLAAQHGIWGCRSSATRSPSTRRPDHAARLPTGDGDGVGDFDLCGGAGVVRAAQPLCAGKKEQRPARDDVGRLSAQCGLHADAGRRALDGTPPVVTLDDRYYLLHAAMRARFPAGTPSLRGCTQLTVKGDVTFGADITVVGVGDNRSAGGRNLSHRRRQHAWRGINHAVNPPIVGSSFSMCAMLWFALLAEPVAPGFA
jgi:UTP--glucose-1-phosphate uridylyltransferase